MSNTILGTSQSGETFSFIVGIKTYQVHSSHPNYAAVKAAAYSGDANTAIDLAKPVEAVKRAVNEAIAADPAAFRRARGKIQVTEDGVTYNGEPVQGYLTTRLLAMLAEGLDISAWVAFAENLFQNPSAQARAEMVEWLEAGDMPITPDGFILAYKIVGPDYLDLYSGRFDNSVGAKPTMSRFDVDDDRRRTCSAGLHFCSKAYLPNYGGFYGAGGSNRIMMVKVNPADVVAIPTDYSYSKGRTWTYEVIAEASLAEIEKAWGLVEDQWYERPTELDEDDYDYEEADTDPLVDEDGNPRKVNQTERGILFAAYYNNFGPRKGSVETEEERAMRLIRVSALLDKVVTSFSDIEVGDGEELVEVWGTDDQWDAYEEA